MNINNKPSLHIKIRIVNQIKTKLEPLKTYRLGHLLILCGICKHKLRKQTYELILRRNKLLIHY